MPEPKILDPIGPRHLLRGDWLYLGDDVVVVNGPPDVKREYVYVPVEGSDRPLRLSIRSGQRVSRLVATAEEMAEVARRRALSTITERIATVVDAVEEAKQTLIGELGIKDPSWHGRAWETYARLQIEADLWATVSTVARNREIDVVEATILVRDDVIAKFTTRFNFVPRSTSAISNHVEALRNDVTAQWIRDLEWVLP